MDQSPKGSSQFSEDQSDGTFQKKRHRVTNRPRPDIVTRLCALAQVIYSRQAGDGIDNVAFASCNAAERREIIRNRNKVNLIKVRTKAYLFAAASLSGIGIAWVKVIKHITAPPTPPPISATAKPRLSTFEIPKGDMKRSRAP